MVSTDSGVILTGLYDSLLPSCHRVCLCHSLSLRPFRHLRGIRRIVADVGAARFLAALAQIIVAWPTSIRLSSSSASTRAVFQTLDLSLISVIATCFSFRFPGSSAPSSSLSPGSGTRRSGSASFQLHRQAGVVDAAAVLLVFQTGKASQGLVSEVGQRFLVRLRHRPFLDGCRPTTCQDQQVEQRVRAEAVGTMHRGAGAFAAA